MVTKMLKSKKENKTNSKVEPKKKKQQLEKIKRAVKKELVEAPALVEVGESPVKKRRGKKFQVIDVDLEETPEAVEEVTFENDEKDEESKDCDVGPEQTIFINNLPANTNRLQLAQLFAPYGKIMFILFGNTSGKKLLAHVVLDSVEAADKALELNGAVFENCTLFVRKPIDKYECSNPENTIFINSEDPSITNEKIQQTFSRCGDIESIYNFKSPTTGLYLPKFCVEFNSPEAVDSALKIKCTIIDKNPIQVQKYRDFTKIQKKRDVQIKPEVVEKKRIVSTSENTVFVSRLNVSTTSIELKKFFSSCGKVAYAKILKRFPEGVSRGLAYVCFKNPEAVKLALTLNDTMLEEKAIRVENFSPNSLNEGGLGVKAPKAASS